MQIRIIALALLLTSALQAAGQTDDINQTDQQGRKQGYWIKKHPNGATMYEGTFRDDKPVGEFKRYNQNKTLSSVLKYSSDGREADAVFYHPNSFISAKGKYVNQQKEGKWQFYSVLSSGSLISEEVYKKNKRNGLSFQYYPDSTIAEKLNFVNGIREGEWLQYHPGGKLFLRSYFTKDKLNGKFEIWYPDGKYRIKGAYKNDMRDGPWSFYSEDGKLKYVINYVMGETNDHQLEDEIAGIIEKMEKNKGKISDPEKTGEIR